jgi:predicted cupin superfamily sugar epimerase
MQDIHYWIDRLQLKPHPEGGFYRETYRAPLQIGKSALPDGFHGPRHASTAIYFLIDGANFSAFHRIAADEMWHFYAGSALAVEVIDPAGQHSQILVGNNPDVGESFQTVVPAGCWFASHVRDPESFALVGCTVAPGFDFADFEIAECARLTAQYPQHSELIKRLTRR